MKTKLRKRVQFQTTKPSRTQQHLKDECDVNSILEKYRKTGHISHVRQNQPQYGDFSGYQDLKTNLDIIKNAFNEFDALPSQIRKRFGNDPAQLIDFVNDPKNVNEAISLGIMVPKGSQNDDKTTKKEPIPEPTPKTENPS